MSNNSTFLYSTFFHRLVKILVSDKKCDCCPPGLVGHCELPPSPNRWAKSLGCEAGLRQAAAEPFWRVTAGPGNRFCRPAFLTNNYYSLQRWGQQGWQCRVGTGRCCCRADGCVAWERDLFVIASQCGSCRRLRRGPGVRTCLAQHSRQPTRTKSSLTKTNTCANREQPHK